MRDKAKNLRILVADDHEAVRRGVREIFRERKCIRVVGEAIDGVEAVELTRRLKPDVVVMDVKMPRLDGLAATRKISAAFPRTRVVVFTVYETDDVARQAVAAGARGLVLKSDMGDRLSTAVVAVACGEASLTPRATEMVLKAIQHTDGRAAKLTRRENETLCLLANGSSNKEVAVEFGVTVKTAENYRAQIMAKLNLHNLAELTKYALQNGIAEIDGLTKSEPAF